MVTIRYAPVASEQYTMIVPNQHCSVVLIIPKEVLH